MRSHSTAEQAIELLVSRATETTPAHSTPDEAAVAADLLRSAFRGFETVQSELAEALIATQDRFLAMKSLAQLNVRGVASDQTVGLLLREALRLTGAATVMLLTAEGAVVTAGDTEDLDSQVAAAWRAIADNPRELLRHSATGCAVIATLDPDADADNYLAIFRRPDRPFSTVDIPVVEGIVSSLGVMLAFNALHRRDLARAVVEREHQLASALAQSVISKGPPLSNRLDMFARTNPAAIAGGDFYVFGRALDTVWFAVGDVAGKGLPAAMLMTRAVAACRVAFLTHRDATVRDVIATIEDELYEHLDEAGLFITMAVGAINEATSTLSVASAGHSPIVWVDEDGASLIPASSPPIGIIRNRLPQITKRVMRPGDCLLIGSDGITEQTAPDGEMFGYDRFVELCRSMRSRPAAEQGRIVCETVHGFAAGNQPSDDSTLVIVQTLAEASMSGTVHTSLRLEPSALAVRQVGPWLRSSLTSLGTELADAVMMKAELAVHEACMNVVDHANLPSGSTIDVHLELTPERLVVRVCDPGDEFDLAAVPEPAPMTLQERGYGVKIIRSLVSELTYRRLGSVNELRLHIDINQTHE